MIKTTVQTTCDICGKEILDDTYNHGSHMHLLIRKEYCYDYRDTTSTYIVDLCSNCSQIIEKIINRLEPLKNYDNEIEMFNEH